MPEARRSWREVRVDVDLTGSNCGPGWTSVDMTIAAPVEQSDEHVRESVAQHYAVPLEQVGPVRGDSLT